MTQKFQINSLLLATILLAVALLVGCGGVGHGATASPTQGLAAEKTSAVGKPTESSLGRWRVKDKDQDNDVGAPGDDTDNATALGFGRSATVSQHRRIEAAVKSYYTQALAEDGAKACSMVYYSLREAVPEDYGRGSAAASYLQPGTTCPQVLTLLFKHFHDQLAVEAPLLKVSEVQIHGAQGIAMLGFASLPMREIRVERERHTWRMGALLDSELP